MRARASLEVQGVAPGIIATRRYWGLGSGDVSLDFANTRRSRLRITQEESFFDIRDVLDWLHAHRLLHREAYRRWRARFRRSPELSRRIFAEALQLREALYRVFWAVANQRTPAAGDVGVVNRLLATGMGRPTLAFRQDGYFTLTHRFKGDPVAELLGPIAAAAAMVLSEQDPRRIRRCLNRECGSVFFDRTKNAGRRWCHMQICGAAIKMRRYRARGSGRPLRRPA